MNCYLAYCYQSREVNSNSGFFTAGSLSSNIFAAVVLCTHGNR